MEEAKINIFNDLQTQLTISLGNLQNALNNTTINLDKLASALNNITSKLILLTSIDVSKIKLKDSVDSSSGTQDYTNITRLENNLVNNEVSTTLPKKQFKDQTNKLEDNSIKDLGNDFEKLSTILGGVSPILGKILISFSKIIKSIEQFIEKYPLLTNVVNGIIILCSIMDKLGDIFKKTTMLLKGFFKILEITRRSIMFLGKGILSIGGIITITVSKIFNIINSLRILDNTIKGLSSIARIFAPIGNYITFIIGSIFTFIKLLGSFSSSMQALSIIGLVFNGISKAVSLLTGVFRVLTLTIMANPIMAIVTALAMGSVLIIANWDKVKVWFANFVEWLKGTILFKMFTKGFNMVGKLFGKKEDNVIVNKDPINKVRNSDNKSVNNVNNLDNNNQGNNISNRPVYNFNINANDQNPIDIAAEIEKIISKHERLSLVG